MDEVQAKPQMQPAEGPEDQHQVTSTRQLFGLLRQVVGAGWKAARSDQAVKDLRPQKDKAHDEWEQLGQMLERDVPVRYQDLAWREVKRHLREAGLINGQYVK
ncbi:hypothetical protein [Streptomyces sp. NPDC091371]|uniref:hypothetical protein n=1 Tax=Streptomyces sp. NPDC091371 TaxID=3155303 RepID=UPI00342D8939